MTSSLFHLSSNLCLVPVWCPVVVKLRSTAKPSLVAYCDLLVISGSRSGILQSTVGPLIPQLSESTVAMATIKDSYGSRYLQQTYIVTVTSSYSTDMLPSLFLKYDIKLFLLLHFRQQMASYLWVEGMAGNMCNYCTQYTASSFFLLNSLGLCIFTHGKIMHSV